MYTVLLLVKQVMNNQSSLDFYLFGGCDGMGWGVGKTMLSHVEGTFLRLIKMSNTSAS